MNHSPQPDRKRPITAPRPERKPGWVLVLTLLLSSPAVLAGCEESVDPIVGTDLPFTLWGFLNAEVDTQYVRVFAISDHLIPDPDETLDARVFSTDLTTGDRREWNYQRLRFDSLITGHYFWSPFQPVHEHRYRLEVVRSDQETSIVEVTVPPEAEFDVDVDLGSTEVPVSIRGEVPNLVGLRVTYHAVNVPPMLAWPPGTVVAGAVQLPVTIIYDQVAEVVPGGWEFVIDMARDYAGVQSVYRLNCLITVPEESAPDIWLREVEFTALAADSTWAPPGGTYDPNLLSVPGTFTNVENGYGFFGAGQGIRMDWTPNITTSLAAGYDFEPRCRGFSPRDEPECWNPPVPCVDERLRDFWQLWLR
jgi:hypothetical protein